MCKKLLLVSTVDWQEAKYLIYIYFTDYVLASDK